MAHRQRRHRAPPAPSRARRRQRCSSAVCSAAPAGSRPTAAWSSRRGSSSRPSEPSGTPSASAAERQQSRQHGYRQPSERHLRGDRGACRRRSAASRPRPASASSPASAATLERDQHERERARRRRVEAELELGEDRHCERLVLDDLERPVLGQQTERDEQAAAEHRRPDLAQRDLAERLPRAQPEAARRLLQARVDARPARGRPAGTRAGTATAS